MTISAFDFKMLLGSSPTASAVSRYCQDLICQLLTGLPVPHGATIVGAEIDACDNAASGGSVQVSVFRAPGNEGDVVGIGEPTLAGPGCTYTYSAIEPHVVDQYLGNYLVVVEFNGSGGVDVRFQAVRVYYRSGAGEVIPTGTVPSLFP